MRFHLALSPQPLALLLAAVFFLPPAVSAQVSFERIVNSAAEPQNWLTYNGNYNGQRHSSLKQITAANAKNLELKWVFQAQNLGTFQATPLVVDGIIYTTQAPNDVIALDARTGRVFWIYRYPLPSEIRICCGQVNRGLAILGDTLFMGTIDANLVAIDSGTSSSRRTTATTTTRCRCPCSWTQTGKGSPER